MKSLKALLIVPLLWANAVPGAETPQPWRPADLELDEVLVQGRKPADTQERLTAWLSRLVGEFRYEGYVERRGSTETAFDRVAVQGGSRCTNIGAPGLVRCEMNVSWQQMQGTGAEIPGGVSWLTPAVAVYGLYVGFSPRAGQAPDSQYIGHMQVDSRGLAEIGLGQLFDDTLIYKAPCADLPGNCQRVVQIEAPLDAKVIRMSVEVQRDSKLEVRHVFEWHRVPQTLATADSPAPTTVARTGNSVMPAAMQNWAGRLVGKYRLVGSTDITYECMASITRGQDGKKYEGNCGVMRSEAECVNIGSGPGVHCVHALGWQDTRVPASSLSARFELWGYDPVAKRMVHADAWPVAPAMIKKLGGMTFATATSSDLSRETLTLTLLCPRDSDCVSPKMLVFIPSNGRLVRYSSFLPATLTRPGSSVPYQVMERFWNESADGTPRKRDPSPRRP